MTMRFVNIFMLLLFLPIIFAATDFQLLDRVCVVVEGEDPILLSEIRKRKEQRNESFLQAQRALTDDRLLWVYAKKQLKYDISQIFKATDEHIARVMQSNKLTRSQFETVLMNPPYSTTFRQFRLETATEYLKNSVKQTISSQISISDDQLREQAAKKFEVVFITVHPKKIARKLTKEEIAAANLKGEFNKANLIRSRIQPTTSVNDIRMHYGKETDISIIGPIAYKKDALKKVDEDRLKANPEASVIGPFVEDGAVTMIWKIKKNLDDTALEKLRKESYYNAVLEKYDAIIHALINNSTVIEKGCDKL